MALTIDGNSLIFTGTLTVSNFTSPTNGVCTLTLTPSGGVGSLPALLAGEPGQPTNFTVGTVTTLSPGADATFTLTQTDAGGAGVAAAYTIDVGLPQGQDGNDGTSGTLAGCSDLTGTAALNKVPVVTGTGPTAFTYTKLPFGFVVNPSSITSWTNVSGVATKQLTTVAIAAQPWPYIPVCLATVTVAGTANTVVNLQASLTAGVRSGDIIGEANGYAGQATQTLVMNSGFGSTLTGSGYGVVAANTTANIVLNAIETASTADLWSISNSTASFTIIGIPVTP